MSKDDALLEFSVYEIFRTPNAILVNEYYYKDHENYNEDESLWLPLSQITIDDDGGVEKIHPPDMISVFLPEWLAKEKGLV